ncbi:uncharacterized protein LOC133727003 isoform X1 [Rosa rugosa]|uniref:uncharacterized protein LOC133727003 isoform X1 n=1 Tax=Rosa rugosa TaxID=74645 RepID=UPI002B411C68|nr:uncharacterized protein LOC133727003 isoform X1 [Rosa rugosa]
MKKTSKGESAFYAPIPANPDHPQHVVVLTHYRGPSPDYHERRRLRLCVSTTVAFVLLSAAAFFLFPSDPALELARIHLNHVGVHSSPKLTLDLSFWLTIRVRNRDFFSLDYDSLVVKIGYRGRELGFVSSAGGRVRARGSSYVNATLVLDGLEVIHDVFYLLEDLARGVIPFDTDTEVDGTVGLFVFKIPIKGRASCEVYVNTNNQTVVRQDCYPE